MEGVDITLGGLMRGKEFDYKMREVRFKFYRLSVVHNVLKHGTMNEFETSINVGFVKI